MNQETVSVSETSKTVEEQRDERQIAADVARTRLAEAKTALDTADAALDGSPEAAQKWEDADRVHRLRMREYAAAERRFQEAEKEIQEAHLQALRAEYAELQERGALAHARMAIDELARRVVDHACEVQRGLGAAEHVAEEQATIVRRLRYIGPEIGETVIVATLDADEAAVIFGQRLRQRALDAHVVLDALVVDEPQVLDREPRVDEQLVPVHIEKISAARVRRAWWSQSADFFKKGTP